eukprot:120776_1
MASSNNTWITEMLQLINPHCTLNETIQQLASLGYNQAATHAWFLFLVPDHIYSRLEVTKYLCDCEETTLQTYFSLVFFEGISIEESLRVFFMSLRLRSLKDTKKFNVLLRQLATSYLAASDHEFDVEDSICMYAAMITLSESTKNGAMMMGRSQLSYCAFQDIANEYDVFEERDLMAIYNNICRKGLHEAPETATLSSEVREEDDKSNADEPSVHKEEEEPLVLVVYGFLEVFEAPETATLSNEKLSIVHEEELHVFGFLDVFEHFEPIVTTITLDVFANTNAIDCLYIETPTPDRVWTEHDFECPGEPFETKSDHMIDCITNIVDHLSEEDALHHGGDLDSKLDGLTQRLDEREALCICEKETIECDDLDKEETPDRCLECVWLETQSDHSFEIHLSQEEELQDGVSSDHEELEYMRSLRLDSRYGVDKCESSRVDLICEVIASFGVEVESIC